MEVDACKHNLSIFSGGVWSMSIDHKSTYACCQCGFLNGQPILVFI